MSIENGSRLGPYEVVSRLGAGGMGEVYRARDPRLGRDVAIKVLPDAFAADPERLARFEREAKLLASLQHANIAVLHGLEEADGRRFLVMQCVEGESLASRLARGALPVPDALEIAAAIAAALEAAHEAGIVHRDLKPGNVMVTPAGEVKVLDFGLAKGGAGAGTDVALSASPTRTYAATDVGVILGTAAYMSPEQSRGKPVDRRTDIWSFGCVLFELLTGQQAFAGETVSDIVARILQTEPEWALLPAATPGRVRDLLVRCLQKDARRRLRDIGDARLELEDVIAGRVSASGAHLTTATTAAAQPRPWLVPALAGLVVVAAAAAWFAARALPSGPAPAPVRFDVAAPHGQTLPQDAVCAAISPDGRSLALLAADSVGVTHLWIRPMESFTARLLPGTENATQMFWSPDSRSLGFFAGDRRMFKVAVAGGQPEPLCDVKTARGGTWNRDGVILLAPFSSGAIYRVTAAGGDPVAVVHPDSAHGETALRFPYFLPDGRHFLFSSLPADSSGKDRICVASIDGGPRKLLLRAESGVVYAEPGWLVYGRRGVLVAQRFDAGALELKGDPVPLGDVPTGTQFGGGLLVSASRTGVLAFTTLNPAPNRLVWLDLQAHEIERTPVPIGLYLRPELSPDGTRVLMIGVNSDLQNFIALADLGRGMVSIVVPPEVQSTEMVWMRDGRGLACVEDNNHEQIVVRSLVDDSRRVFLASDPSFKRLNQASPDGRFLLFERLDSATKWDIWMLPIDGSGPPRPLVHSAANEIHASLSPDGRWLAFESDESGVDEVYVVPMGAAGMRYQVTSGGGSYPTWTADGKRLLFASGQQADLVMQADVVPGAAFSLGPARTFARIPEEVSGLDINRTATRILALVPAEKRPPQAATVLQNWTAALHRP